MGLILSNPNCGPGIPPPPSLPCLFLTMKKEVWGSEKVVYGIVWDVVKLQDGNNVG